MMPTSYLLAACELGRRSISRGQRDEIQRANGRFPLAHVPARLSASAGPNANTIHQMEARIGSICPFARRICVSSLAASALRTSLINALNVCVDVDRARLTRQWRASVGQPIAMLTGQRGLDSRARVGKMRSLPRTRASFANSLAVSVLAEGRSAHSARSSLPPETLMARPKRLPARPLARSLSQCAN